MIKYQLKWTDLMLELELSESELCKVFGISRQLMNLYIKKERSLSEKQIDRMIDIEPSISKYMYSYEERALKLKYLIDWDKFFIDKEIKTQADFARETGITQTAISIARKGKWLSPIYYRRIEERYPDFSDYVIDKRLV